ncbi:MAG TPA: two-component regulator propeller domain-containing protein, partial [Geothrix sp.]|nr:two-component regulator propeller domain-containing protein [Geothrix sp.]
CVALSGPLGALESSVSRPQARIQRVWRSEAGLQHDTATALAEGRDGALWIGTEDGLVCFDGSRFNRFSRGDAPAFSHHDVHSLAGTADGSLWIGTTQPGLFRLKEGVFTALGSAEGLPDSPILRLLEDRRGTLWAAPMQGPLLRLEGGRFLPVPLEGSRRFRIRALAEDAEGTLWIGTAGSGLWRLQNQRMELVALSAGDLTALAVDASGTVWAGSRDQGLLHLVEGRLEPPAWSQSLPARPITALHAGRDGSLWIGTEQAGLFQRTRDGRLEAAPGGPKTRWTVLSLLEDRGGTLWIGSEDRGLRASIAVPFQAIPAADPEPDAPVRMVCQDTAGVVWCLSGDQSLGQIRDGRTLRVLLGGALGPEPISALWPRRAGGLWIGTRGGGLFILDQGRAQRVPGLGGPPTDGILSLYEDPAGSLWVALARQGLMKLPPGGGAPQFFPLARGVVAMTGGGAAPVYLASTSLGLGILDAEGLRWLGSAQGLGSIGAQALHLDAEGHLWIGTADGLRRFWNGAFHAFSSPQGLLKLSIHAIQEDANQRLWLSTSQGVLQAPRAALMQGLPLSGPSPLAIFDHGDGLPARETQRGPQPAAWLTREGDLWVPTSRGLARLDPRFLPTPPPLNLRLVKVLSDESVLPAEGSLTLQPGSHRLEIHYTAISLTDAGKVRFRYRLEGIDPGWNEVGDRRFAVYSSLPPGARRFLLQAWRPGEDRPPQELALPITVQPFFHQRPLFWALCAAAAGLFGWWLLRLRLQQVEARSAVLDERNRMAREIHDHLAQGFTGVLLQLEAAEARLARMEGDPEPVLTRLGHARELAAASLQEARRSVMALSPRKPEGADLLGSLRILSDRLLAGTGIQVELAQSGTPRPLGPRVEEELLRMAQEALTNALRHGKARWVRVTIQHGSRQVRLRIEDDGQGFDPSKGASGYGLRSIRETLRQLRGHIDIDSGPGLGTRITITLPLRRWRP